MLGLDRPRRRHDYDRPAQRACLPRHHGRLRRSVCGAPASRALSEAGCEVGVCVSSAGIEVLATELHGDPRSARTRSSRGLTDGLEGVDRLRDGRLLVALRERLGEGRRLRHLPVLDGHLAHDRRRRDGEPRSIVPPRWRSRRGVSSSWCPVRRRSRRSTSRTCCGVRQAGAVDPLCRAGLLPRPRDHRRSRRLRRRALSRPARDRQCPDEAMGPAMTS